MNALPDGADRDHLAAWLDECVARPGRLPAGCVPVHTRLIRAVGRGRLPGGTEVYLKTMGFPRPRDRLRYWLRPLPAAHEAAMLHAAAAAGVPCPRVLAIAARRGRCGRPVASVLATEGLALARSRPPRLAECARLGRRLGEAGILHRDLHQDNFVRLDSGECAVLDLQSARRLVAPIGRRARIRLAARLLAADWSAPEQPHAVVEAGLVDTADLAVAMQGAHRHRLVALARRVRRCLAESSEFHLVRRPWGRLVARRELPAGGVWRTGGRELIRVWLGARYGEVADGDPPLLAALFLNSWWLPTRCSVYIASADGVALFEARCPGWLDAYARFKDMTAGGRRGADLPPEGILPWTGRREI
jgi:hypothetical protein